MQPDHVLDAEPVQFSMSEPGTQPPAVEPEAEDADDGDEAASDDGPSEAEEVAVKTEEADEAQTGGA